MNPKIQLIKIQAEMKEFDFSLNIERLRFEVFSFYNNLPIKDIYSEKNERVLIRIVRALQYFPVAKAHFENCISIYKNLFEMENRYILLASKNTNTKLYEVLNENLGVANSRLDNYMEMLENIDKDFQNKVAQIKYFNCIYIIENLKSLLSHYMDDFIIYSLYEAVRKFKKVDESLLKEVEIKKGVMFQMKKDEELFFWYLFKEVYRVAEVEGSVLRKQIKSEIKMVKGQHDGFKYNPAQPTAPTSLSDSDLIGDNEFYDSVGQEEF